jgi:hypothetical protein
MRVDKDNSINISTPECVGIVSTSNRLDIISSPVQNCESSASYRIRKDIDDQMLCIRSIILLRRHRLRWGRRLLYCITGAKSESVWRQILQGRKKSLWNSVRAVHVYGVMCYHWHNNKYTVELNARHTVCCINQVHRLRNQQDLRP